MNDSSQFPKKYYLENVNHPTNYVFPTEVTMHSEKQTKQTKRVILVDTKQKKIILKSIEKKIKMHKTPREKKL